MKSKENIRINFVDFFAMLTIVGFSCVYFFTAATIESYGSDTSTYFELAKSLLHDHKYWFNFEPHTIYPPGFPVLLACLMSFLGESFGVLVKGVLASYFISLIGIYYLVKIQRGAKTAFATVVLIATSYVFYFWSTVGLHSEGPYLLASVYALLFFEVGIKTENKWVRLFSFFLVSLFSADLLLQRSIGITLVIGMILWMLNPIKCILEKSTALSWDRVKKLFPVLLIPMIVFIAWTTWCSQNRLDNRSGDYMGSYATQLLKKDPHQIDSPNISLGEFPSRMLFMMNVRVKNAALMLFNIPSRTLTWTNPILLLFFAVLSIGFFSALIGEGNLVDYYVLSYAGVLLIWPFDEGMRFLLPIQPFLILYAINGIERLFDILESKRLKKFYIPFVSLFATIMLFATVKVYLRKEMSGNDIVSLISGAFLCLYLLYLRFGKSEKLRHKENGTNIQGAALYRYASCPTAKVALFIAIVTLGLYQLYGAARRNLHPDPGTFLNAPTVKVSNWIAQNTKENEIIMDDEHEILHRLTKRKTFRFPLTTDPNLLREKIIENRIDFLVIFNEKEYEDYNPSAMKRFDTVKNLNPELFIPEHDFGQGMIYRVTKGNRRSMSQS